MKLVKMRPLLAVILGSIIASCSDAAVTRVLRQAPKGACCQGKCQEYRGKLNVTLQGRTCQRWDSDVPHSHSYTPESYPNSGLVDNFCRNPSGHKTLWCYTTDPDPDHRWEPCDTSCPTIPDHCANAPCANGGVCSGGESGFQCECASGYRGERCDQVDFCTSNPCKNGGVCAYDVVDNYGSGYQCKCVSGYQGDHCEKVDRCANITCQNGGECEQGTAGSQCKCVKGFYGELCEKVNYCDRSPKWCKNGGVCSNGAEGPQCKCPSGYYGEFCGQANVCVYNPCKNGGVCSLHVDYDYEYGPRYKCECPSGYHGDHCEKVDYCANNPCKNGGECVQDEAGFKCNCIGFFSELCENVDYCESSPCQNGGVCSNGAEGPQCKCPSGYYGEFCGKVDHCANNPCKNGGECVQDEAGFKCNCIGFFSELCENVDYCESSPCQNGGECSNGAEGPQCKCPSGYYGEFCGKANQCVHNPCKNGGVCSLQVDYNYEYGPGYKCECASGYYGDHCEKAAGGNNCSNILDTVTGILDTVIGISGQACQRCFAQVQHTVQPDALCTSSANTAWGAGYAGPITFRSTECYNSSYVAVNAVTNVGYFSSKGFKDSVCANVDWWMEFDNGPVSLSSIAFAEGAGNEGGRYTIWGSNDPNVYVREELGKALLTKELPTVNSGERKFRYIGITSAGCEEYAGSGDRYWSIKDLRFEAH